MTERDRVAWIVIEHGWAVTTSDGEKIGEVESLVGDRMEDVFDGLGVSTGFFETARYVAEDQIAAIYEGEVQLVLNAADAAALPEYIEPPASLEIEGGEASAADKVAGAVTREQFGSRRVTPWRRLIWKVFGRPK